MTTTTLTNNTKEARRYTWVPKHGVTLQPGESVTIKGTLQPKRPRFLKMMREDISAELISVVETFEVIEDAAAPAALENSEPTKVETPTSENEEKEGSTKADDETVIGDPDKQNVDVNGDSTVVNTTIPQDDDEDDEDPLFKSLLVNDDDDQETVDMAGNKIEEEPVFDHRGNLLSDDEAPENALTPAEPEAAGTVIPSRSALKKMSASEVQKMVAEDFQMLDASMSKSKLCAALEELR